MIVIPSKKIVLLLPWKTASQTLRLRLDEVSQNPYPIFFYFNHYLKRVVHQHITLADYLALPESHLGYDLAVFVRNPYDRVFSGFQQLVRDLNEHPRNNYPSPWIRDLVTEQLSSNFASLCKAQYDVNIWFDRISPYEILEAGRNSCFCLHPVNYWTHYGEKEFAGFIGKVETFEESFSRFCAQFGIRSAGSESVNRSDPKLAKQDVNGYLYVNRLQPRTIAKINDLFHADFEYFGYKKI